MPRSARPSPTTLEAIFAACGSREILMYAGAQGVSNGLEVVLDALDHLRSTDLVTYERLAVVLIGDGGRHDELVREATERGHPQLYFHPPIDKAAVPGALARATLLLVAFADADVYRYGLSPNKLFDYLAAGRPVLLASRLDDTPVSEADAGRCYEPGSGPSLAEGIAALLALPPDERVLMGLRGQELVRRRYTIAVTGAQLESALLELVGTSG